MALDASIEVYLSLITVFIMCIPGLAFLVQRLRNRKTKETRRSESLPIHEQRIWTAACFDNTIIRLPAAPYHQLHAGEEPHLVNQGVGPGPMRSIGFIELVSGL